MTDGKTYTLTYKDADKKETTATFTVSDGKIAAFGLTPLKVTYNVATALKYQKLDANGMVLGETAVDSPDANISVSYKFTNEAGSYHDDSKIFLPNVGDKATITIVQHTYQYNADGSEKDTIKGEFEVEAVSAATTVENYTYTVSINAPAWEKLTASTVNTKVCMEDTNYRAFFLIKDSNGNDVTGNGYTVESADNSILIADGGANGASLTPVKEGSTVLIVKDANGNSVKTVNIQVVAKRVLSSVALNRSTVSFSAGATADNQVIYVTGKDQYGAPFGITSIAVTNNLAVDGDVLSVAATTANVAAPFITFSKTAATHVAGTYGYSIKVNDSIPTSATVKVMSASGSTKHGFVFNAKNTEAMNPSNAVTNVLNTTVLPTTTQDATLTATVVERVNGATTDASPSDVTVSAIKVYRVGGDTIANATYKQGNATPTVTVSSAAITKATLDAFVVSGPSAASFDIVGSETNSDGDYVKNLKPGTYKVQATIYIGTEKYTSEDSFEVVDNQASITASVLNTAIDASDIKDALRSEDNVKYYDATGRVADGAIVGVAAAHGSKNGKNAYIKTVDLIIEQSDDAGNKVNVVIEGIAINRTFTTKSGATWSNVVK